MHVKRSFNSKQLAVRRLKRWVLIPLIGITIGIEAGCGDGTRAVVTPTPPTPPSAPVSIYTEPIVAFGDSLTCGGQGNAYGQAPLGSMPDALAALLGVTLVNQGVGGNTSNQIAVRDNAASAKQVVTLANNQIPTVGAVEVAFPTGFEPVTYKGGNNGADCYKSLSGLGTNVTINGIAGSVTVVSGKYLFTPTASPPGAVTTTVKNPYNVSTPYQDHFLIDSSATNDVLYEYSNYIPAANDKAIVALAGTQYLVASALPADMPGYWPSGRQAAALAEVNAGKASAFGSHYVDTLTPLLSGCQPVAGSTIALLDAIDVGHGIVPTSCRTYSSGPVVKDVNSSQTTICVAGTFTLPPYVGEIGYLSHTRAPIGLVEAFQIKSIAPQSNCSSGLELSVTRGYAGTPTGSYSAATDTWGFWDRMHLSGGAPNTALAAQTGYRIQAAALAEAYKQFAPTTTSSVAKALTGE